MAKFMVITAMLMMASSSILAQQTPAIIADQIVAAAIERTTHQVQYNGQYRRLEYPGGDVPDSLGVCTDVVIRVYRAIDIDLQLRVHEDMAAHFEEYPQFWGLTRPDPNIDHRRVPNLQTFLKRHGAELPVTHLASDYLPGDLVTWMLPGNLPHIGVVVNQNSVNQGIPLIVHNIGRGPAIDDILFRYTITGHYRYLDPNR